MSNYEIKVVENNRIFYIHQCLAIAQENLVENGGTLRFPSLVRSCKYVVCALKDDEVLGYVGLVENFATDDDLYVMQIAVKKSEAGKGIGSQLLEYVKQHSKGYRFISSHVDKSNAISNKLHIKEGFEIIDTGSRNLYIFPTNRIAERDTLSYTDETLEHDVE